MATNQVNQPDFIPDDQPPQQSQPPDFIANKDAPQQPDFISDEQTGKDYGSLGQQALAGVEGAAQGLAGPLAPLAETHLLGVSPEDIAGRAEANPITHGVGQAAGLIGGTLAPIGQGALIARAVPEVAALGKIGAFALKGALEGAALQGSDEMSKWVLGKENPETPVASALAHMGAAGLFGGVAGSLFGITGLGATKGLQAIEDSKISDRASSFLAGYGAAEHQAQETGQAVTKWDPVSRLDAKMKGVLDLGKETGEVADQSAFKAGLDFHANGAKQIADAAIDRATEGLAFATAHHISGGLSVPIAAGVLARKLEPYIEQILDKPLTATTQKFVMPIITKALTSGKADAIATGLKYATKWDKGAQTINKSLDSIFRRANQQGINYFINQKDKEAIDDAVSSGTLQDEMQNQQGNQAQGMAKGGKVEKPKKGITDFSEVFPTHAMMLTSAKARVFNYLNNLKPRAPVGQLPYDNKEYTPEKGRRYEEALDIATNPMIVMKHAKDGTITQDHVRHFTEMWPEISSHLSKKIQERIVANKIMDEKPPFKVRQSLSLLTGQPLESAFTPAYIQAAQMTYQPSGPIPQPPMGKPKKNTAKLGDKSNKMAATPEQAAEADQAKR